MADGFIWYELVTNHMDKAVAFYKKVVGWDVRDSGMPGMPYMLFGNGGKDVGGMMTWSGAGMPEMPPEWLGHIHTAKLDDELSAVTADGGMVLRPATDIPGIGRFAVVMDPQKAKYLLFEPGEGQTPAPRAEQNAPGTVGWHELLAADGAKAWDYYSKHYGWQKDYAHDMGPMGVYQTFRMDKPRYSGGMMTAPEGAPHGWKFYFVVDDIEAAKQRVTDAGGTITMGPMDTPGDSRILQGVDDQGCVFCLVQTAKE